MSQEPEFQAHRPCFQCGELHQEKKMVLSMGKYFCDKNCRDAYDRWCDNRRKQQQLARNQ
jgi:formylmethanofuran dehydrogenase subunit E